MQGVKNGVTPSGNEYFDNLPSCGQQAGAAEGENKAAEWVGYIFPSP